MQNLKKILFFSTLFLILAWLSIYVVNVKDYASWFADDWATYRKLEAYQTSWQQAYLFRANILQLYFIVIEPFAKLLAPILNYSNSLTLINYSDVKFFNASVLVLFTLNIIFLISYYITLEKIFNNKLLSIASVFLITISTSFNLWLPQIETRYIGFIFTNIAVYYYICKYKEGLNFIDYFLIGILFCIGFNLHYTSAYLIAPIVLFYFYSNISNFKKEIKKYTGFILAFVVFYIILEIHSLKAGIPPWKGVIARTIWSGSMEHKVPEVSISIYLEQVYLFISYFFDEYGIYLGLLLIIALIYSLIRPINNERDKYERYLAITAFISYILISPLTINYIFFRKSIPLQFILYPLFIINSYRFFEYLKSKKVFLAYAWVAILIVCIANLAAKSMGIVEAHFSLGHMVNEFEKDHPKSRITYTIPRVDTLTPYSMSNTNNYDYLVTEYPVEYFNKYPLMYSLFEMVPPIKQSKRIWSTQTLEAENGKYIGFSLLKPTVTSRGSIYSIQDIKNFLRESELLSINKIEVFRNNELLSIPKNNLLNKFTSPSNSSLVTIYDKSDVIKVEITLKSASNIGLIGIQYGAFFQHEARPSYIDIKYLDENNVLKEAAIQDNTNFDQNHLVANLNGFKAKKIIITMSQIKKYLLRKYPMSLFIYGVYFPGRIIEAQELPKRVVEDWNKFNHIDGEDILSIQDSFAINKMGFESAPRLIGKYKFNSHNGKQNNIVFDTIICNNLIVDTYQMANKRSILYTADDECKWPKLSGIELIK